MADKILVIGGVAAGATGAAKARRTSEDVEITMVEKGKYISFANCGLPYYTGGTIESRSSILLHTRQSFGNRFNTDVLTKTEAIAIDPKAKSVLLKTSKGEIEKPYDKLLLAVGAKTFIPPIEGIADVPFHTMRTVEDADGVKKFIEKNKPKRALVIGAGFIGIEVAEAMLHCDIKPTVVEALDEVMPNFPPVVAMNLREQMVKSGCDVIIKTYVTKMEQDGELIKAHLSDGRVLETDLVIMCTGVKPAVDLPLTGGVELGATGGVAVNERMETNVKDIYAAGDLVEKVNLVTGKKCLLPLAGPANREGRTAGANMAGGDMTFKGVLGSAVVGFDGFVMAQTGLTYKQALEAGFDADYVYTEDVNRSSYYPVHGHIFMMTVYDKKSGKLLGVSACGADGTEKKVDHAAVAIYSGLTVYDLENLELCYAPPFASAKDNMNIAGFVASNALRGSYVMKPEWLLEQVRKGADIQIVDVRTELEYEMYKVEGSINIYVNELRSKIELLDKTRPVYVYCAVGFRGYLATRALRNMGYEAYNITGGIEAYERLKRL